YRYVTQFLGRRIDMTGEITGYDQNKKYSFRSTSGPIPMEGSFIFESDEKSTRVTMTIEANISGFFKLAEPVVVRMFRRQFEADLANLKDLLEVQAGNSS
ncbi:MAG: hypothetical protein FJW66_04125, partial [Actinobacteria bacterium]|nr:hypothetical protein [Actinomycetota bacterium]